MVNELVSLTCILDTDRLLYQLPCRSTVVACTAVLSAQTVYLIPPFSSMMNCPSFENGFCTFMVPIPTIYTIPCFWITCAIDVEMH